ncbi:hypothetical protein [Winogradskyella aquimaris]|uniref:HprK-related kinase B n=1 Tax=Winogradskyella aquimaris TaxID=864074 RepID=A0ABU5EM18_9FLAO|nr:hypothetical protein [Winogradskyella aquimaris]MDY2587096.1 hypothetical protein [Winogradskyella aquimaris]
MNHSLGPTYEQLLGSHWVLWYKTSNRYSIVDENFKALLDAYLQSESINTFRSNLDIANADTIADRIQYYLEQCHTQDIDQTVSATLSFKPVIPSFSIHYECFGQRFQINFDSELVKKTIHPSIAHLEVNTTKKPNVVFDVYLDQDQLCLFKNKTLLRSAPKKDYHLIQGKFVMELLSLIHQKEESDWVGTFHGSTISDGTHALLLMGESGKGKSTLSALLVAHGFELVADDVSPLLSKDLHIYSNPSAISLKEGAFEVLNPLVRSFEEIPETLFNKSKGPLKYLVPNPLLKGSYSCKALIMVNYAKGKPTKLEPLSIKTPLETLIPESWLSPKPKHARQFLDWLAQLKIYELTYSDTASVVKEISTLFKTLPNAQD